MSTSFDRELEERFVRYARIDTQSDAASPTSPSTPKQFNLLNLLVDELKEMGAQDVTLTEYGAVLASIPATVPAGAPTIAFLAHVDTAPQFTGKEVKPIVHRKYNGEDILLPDEPHQPAGAVAALTGARFAATRSSGAAVAWNETLVLAAGETLNLGQAQDGCRCWLALRGGQAVPQVMRSRSTLLPAGFGEGILAVRCWREMRCHVSRGWGR